MGLRITSWNVNGIRNPFSYQPWRETKTYQAMFDILEADIVVMQETKIQRKDLQDDMVLVPGWDVYFSLPRFKKGYSGVVIYTRNSKCCPIRAEEGLTGISCPPKSAIKFRDMPPGQCIGGYPQPGQLSSSTIDLSTLDSEGRCMVLEFPAFVLIGVYSPATRDDTRTDFRLAFLDALDVRVRNLVAMGKQVVLAGDLNIIRGELDTAGIAEQLRRASMTLEDFISMPSRRFLNQLVFGGTVVGGRREGREPVLWDLCREFHPKREGMYTCWETRKNARPGNFGSRIDYVLCSNGIRHWFVDANIQEGLLGSDHCPVYATLGDVVKLDPRNDQSRDVHVLDYVNPRGMFHRGKRLRDWSVDDMLPQSAKLMPSFDRRQNIKDMFKRAPQSTSPTLVPPMITITAADAYDASPLSLFLQFPPVLSPVTSNVRESPEESRGPPPRSGSAPPPARSPFETPRSSSSSSSSSATTSFASSSLASIAFSSRYNLPSQLKRSIEPPPSTASRPQKKSKGGGSSTPRDVSSSNKSGGLSRAQTSLRGFFTTQSSNSSSAEVLKDGQNDNAATGTSGKPAAATIAFATNPPLAAPAFQTKKTPAAVAGAPPFLFAIKPSGAATPPTATTTTAAAAPAQATLTSSSSSLSRGSGSEPYDPAATIIVANDDYNSTGGNNNKEEDGQNDDKMVVDPIESKESWSKLLGGRVPPKCEHDEPCISMLTKKAGVNRGRSFYCCGRPLGPSGAKEKGTEWRCGTFVWSSDWTGGGGGGGSGNVISADASQ